MHQLKSTSFSYILKTVAKNNGNSKDIEYSHRSMYKYLLTFSAIYHKTSFTKLNTRKITTLTIQTINAESRKFPRYLTGEPLQIPIWEKDRISKKN